MTLLSFSMSAQDAIFSQFYSAPVYVNPALAGAVKCGRLSLNYRNQWSAIPGTFSFINASYDQHIDKISGALGLVATSVQEGNGSYRTTYVGGVYSYNIQVNDVFSIKTALQASYVNRRVDWNELTFPDQFDDVMGLARSTSEQILNTPANKHYVDFSAGIVGFSENFYAGFAVHHLARPDESFIGSGTVYRLPMKFTAHAGAVIDLVPKRYRFRTPNAPTLSPNIIYQQQGPAQQLNYGIYASFHPIVFGAWFRQTISFENRESLAFLVGIKLNAMNVGYSYDLSLNKLKGVSGGSHEISVSYAMRCREPKHKFKMINCPSF